MVNKRRKDATTFLFYTFSCKEKLMRFQMLLKKNEIKKNCFIEVFQFLSFIQSKTVNNTILFQINENNKITIHKILNEHLD